MAYAPHTNNDYACGADVPLLIGQFTEKDYGNIFEYAARPAGLGGDFAPDARHIMYVGGGQYRFARVLKTVVYVATDEEIATVWEKWQIKPHQHHKYLAQWAIDARDDVIQRGQAWNF
jgi:hypothetical protein